MLPSRTAAALALLSALASPVYGQTGRNVLIVVNDAVPGSIEVAERYAAARAVPPAQILRVQAGPAESISRADFERTIQVPVASFLSAHSLQDQIHYLVLSRGVPLKIVGTPGRQGTAASVDSELTLLYRRMTGDAVAPGGPVRNPYFLGDAPTGEAKGFNRAEQDIYLVTRLDGFTTEDALALVARGQACAAEGKILLDDLPLLSDPRNTWLTRAAERLKTVGHGERVVHDETSRALKDQAGVLGYYSWGSNDRELHVRHPNLSFAPGALAAMFLSADARTFVQPPDGWLPGAPRQPLFGGSNQSLVGDLIRSGVTGVAGQVAEPFLHGVVRPDILFPAYVGGRTLGESFYLATPNLSWQTIIVGDPLCRPFRGDSTPADGAGTVLDPETEYPVHFSVRRLATLQDPRQYGSSQPVRKLLLKAESRAARSDNAGAVAALDEAVRLDPGVLGAWRVLGQLHEAAGRHGEATAAYRRVIELDRNDVPALNNLAYHLAVREQRPGDALPLATRASTLAPGNALVDDTLAWIHHLLGNDREALPLAARAARALPRDGEVQFHAAVIFAAVGRLQDALKAMEAATAADPSIRARADYQVLEKRVHGKN